MSKSQSIKAIDKASVHSITSGQVVVDLQTAVKELLENSIDAGATNVEVRFKNYGITSLEVVDNGSGIKEEDYDSIALKHHTSKLETYEDLAMVKSFGFRGEALSSFCATCESVIVCTATSTTAPLGVMLAMDKTGKVKERSKVARTTGTTVTLVNIFKSLPVRKKEFERNAKREFGKALTLLNAYALGPCSASPGVRLTVTNQLEKGPKTVQFRTLGSISCRDSVTALWGMKALDNVVDMDLAFEVVRERSNLKRLQNQDSEPIEVRVRGLISKFVFGCGRTSADRQFFYVNGRPCNMQKVQKAFNEIYRSFNTNQSPFVVADFVIPTDCYDVNVSPDKRTILIHHEGNLISALKMALETHFSPLRATFDLGVTQSRAKNQKEAAHTQPMASQSITKCTSSQSTLPQQSSMDLDEEDGVDSILRETEASSPILDTATKTCSNISLPSPSLLPTYEVIAEKKAGTPVEEPMIIDGISDGPGESPIVLDTSQTSWGRQMGIQRRSPSPEPSHSSRALASITRDEHDIDRDAEPPLKKQKSDVGFTAIASTIPAISAGNFSNPIPAKGNTAPITHGSAKNKGSNSSINSRRSMRSKLAGFARLGSQVSSQMKITSFGKLSGSRVLEDDQSSIVEDCEEETGEDQSSQPGQEDTDEVKESNGLDDIKDVVRPDEVRSDSAEEEQGLDENHKPKEISVPSVCPSPDNFYAPDPPVNLIDLSADDDDILDSTSVLSLARASSASTPSTVSRKDMIPHPEVIKTEKDGREIVLKFNLDRIKGVWSRKLAQLHQSIDDRQNDRAPQSVPVDASISNVDDDEKAADALARVIEKSDFETMEIVGQFNLGFVVTRRQKLQSCSGSAAEMLDDLFIVDQHAADEKYNFETLQATTRIQSQKLFRPRPLELTASDEMVALENLQILKQNGFELDVNEDNPVGQGSRLKLTAQPVSKDTVFDMKDLEEVIHLLRDHQGTDMVRCSKARAMFASRACRKSVMIGMPLNTHQMTTVIRHMGTMDQPWNCPHGRPTMRHLLDIRHSGSQAKERIDWSSIC